MSTKIIVVNATALDRSGALTILKQFVEAIPINDGFEYIVFVSPNITIEIAQSCVRLVSVNDVKSFCKRFIWDAFGLKKWLNRNNIVPSVAVSLQNTNFRTGYDIPNYIYYHQPIPFFTVKWSLFVADQRPMWFYKNIYPFFVRLFINRRTEIFVQLEFIKEGFVRRFNFSKEKIHVITPKIELPQSDEIVDVELDASKTNLYYPATPYFYKNHRVLIEALSKIKNRDFVLYLTCNKEDLNIDCSGVDVRFMGVTPFEQVLGMYAKADALLFPSYIETYGLPLIEAASFGIPILAADLPYSCEVLEGYQGVEFIDHTDADKWVEGINKLEKNKRYKRYKKPLTRSWQELFRIITQLQ